MKGKSYLSVFLIITISIFFANCYNKESDSEEFSLLVFNVEEYLGGTSFLLSAKNETNFPIMFNATGSNHRLNNSYKNYFLWLQKNETDYYTIGRYGTLWAMQNPFLGLSAYELDSQYFFVDLSIDEIRNNRFKLAVSSDAKGENIIYRANFRIH